MAHVESWGIGEMTVTLDATAGDWTCSENIIPTGYYLYNLAANEYVVIGSGAATTSPMKLTSLAGGEVARMVHQGPPWPVPYKPVMDMSESSFAGTCGLKISFV